MSCIGHTHSTLSLSVLVLSADKQEEHDMLADGGLISKHGADTQAGGRPWQMMLHLHTRCNHVHIVFWQMLLHTLSQCHQLSRSQQSWQQTAWTCPFCNAAAQQLFEYAHRQQSVACCYYDLTNFSV